MHPDPGRALFDKRIAATSAEDRVRWSVRKRQVGRLLVWQQADAAAARHPMTELERAFFILDRLYPEMPPQHREQFRARLATEWEAGTWHGFERPAPLAEAG